MRSKEPRLRYVQMGTPGSLSEGQGGERGCLPPAQGAPLMSARHRVPKAGPDMTAPVLSAGDAFVLPIRLSAPAPGLTQCLLACVCMYILRTALTFSVGQRKGSSHRLADLGK